MATIGSNPNPSGSLFSNPDSKTPDYGAFNSWFNPNSGAAPATKPDYGAFNTLFSKPSGLEQLTSTPSKLDLLAAAPSLNLAQGGSNGGRVTIRETAPVESVLFGTNKNRFIEITVRPLSGGELGTLNTSQANINKQLTAASAKIDAANQKAYKSSTAELRNQASEIGYYKSPAHIAWARAAEARTGGRIPQDWWIKNDPFGGTAGNGPNILASGSYPGGTSRIAMGHDTDWTLGSLFNAGPLKALYGNKSSPTDQGSYGLVPNHSINPDLANLYSDPRGHPDWQVTYGGHLDLFK